MHFVQAQPDPATPTSIFSRTNGILADGLDYAEVSLALRTVSGGIPYGTTVALASPDPTVFGDTQAIDDEGNAALKLRSRTSGMKDVSLVANSEGSLLFHRVGG